MSLATHLIKVKGEFSSEWTEEKLKEYIDRKINVEIDDYYSAQIELLDIRDSTIEVWVFVSALMGTAYLKEMVDKWLQGHVGDEGITVKSSEIVEILTPETILDDDKPGIHFSISM
ncbi:MAG: hypothetical protein R6U44_02720 [Archaeoglobaceae archaeon]